MLRLRRQPPLPPHHRPAKSPLATRRPGHLGPTRHGRAVLLLVGESEWGGKAAHGNDCACAHWCGHGMPCAALRAGATFLVCVRMRAFARARVLRVWRDRGQPELRQPLARLQTTQAKFKRRKCTVCDIYAAHYVCENDPCVPPASATAHAGVVPKSLLIAPTPPCSPPLPPDTAGGLSLGRSRTHAGIWPNG